MKLHISPSLALPLDFVTKTIAILAQRRKGKTYTASVLAEELIAAKVPVVVLDPTGAWWGLRASADGKSAGLPVVILGGQHGDLPLERGAGVFVADLVVDHPGHYVIDFSLLESGEAEREFATAFAQRIYRRKAHAGMNFPMHLIIDEADRFIPQRVPSGDQTMLGAFETIVRRGGLRGLGTTVISQRAAVVNKNVLEQIDTLIVLRNVGPNDQAAILDYVKAKGTPEELKEIRESMASLELGEAWVWEPGSEPYLFKRIKIRARNTFNSSATPEAGKVRVEPKLLAAIDIEAIKGKMAQTIERAKENDPKKLKAEVAALRLQLTNLQSQSKPAPMVPMVDEGAIIERIGSAIAEDRKEIVEMFENWANSFNAKVTETERLLNMRLAKILKIVTDELNDAERVVAASFPRMAMDKGGIMMRPLPKHPAGKGRLIAVPAAPRVVTNVTKDTIVTTSNGDLSRPQLALLRAMSEIEAIGKTEPSRTWVAYMAGVSPLSSGFEKNVGVLRVGGYITYPKDGCLALTQQGRGIAPKFNAPLDTGEMFERVKPLISEPQYALLEQLRFAWPNALTREELATAAGVSSLSSGFEKNVGTLSSRELATYPQKGFVRCADWLYIEGRG